MSRTITLNPLSISSIDNAIAEIRDYQRWVKQKTIQLAEALSRVGIYEASFRFAGAMYDGSNDVSVERTQDNAGSYTITARGQAVAFIEFGAGVYHNSSGAYPLPKPDGIVPIGTYNKGNGSKRGWVYPADHGVGSSGVTLNSKWIFTRGNPAAMPMYYASKEMRDKLLVVAREVFGND